MFLHQGLHVRQLVVDLITNLGEGNKPGVAKFLSSPFTHMHPLHKFLVIDPGHLRFFVALFDAALDLIQFFFNALKCGGFYCNYIHFLLA